MLVAEVHCELLPPLLEGVALAEAVEGVRLGARRVAHGTSVHGGVEAALGEKKGRKEKVPAGTVPEFQEQKGRVKGSNKRSNKGYLHTGTHCSAIFKKYENNDHQQYKCVFTEALVWREMTSKKTKKTLESFPTKRRSMLSSAGSPRSVLP